MRSSAVGEDGLFSFAGQFKTVLNVGLERLAEAYKEVIASKYSVGALLYRVKGGFLDQETPMAVLVLEMIDPAVSGIVYSQSPVSTATASEVLRIWQEERLTEHVAATSGYFLKQLGSLKKYWFVGDVRGIGFMAGIEFVQDRNTKEPFPVEKLVAKQVQLTALQNGLVTYATTGMADGVRGDAISLYPPLIFSEQHMDECVSKLHDTFAQVGQNLA